MKWSLIFILAIASLVGTEINGQTITELAAGPQQMNNAVFFRRMTRAVQNYDTMKSDDLSAFSQRIWEMAQNVIKRDQFVTMYNMQNNELNQCSISQPNMEKFYTMLTYIQMDSSRHTMNINRVFSDLSSLAYSAVPDQMIFHLMTSATAFSTAYNNSVKANTNKTLIAMHQNCATTLLPTFESVFNASVYDLRPCLRMKIDATKVVQSIGDWFLFWLSFNREVSGCCSPVNPDEYQMSMLNYFFKIQMNRWCLENLAQKIPFAYGGSGMGSIYYYPASDIGPSSDNKNYDAIKLSEYLYREINNFGATTSSYFYGCFESYSSSLISRFSSLKTSFENCIK